MTFIHLDTASIEVCAAFMQAEAANIPRAISSGLKSTGFWVLKLLRQERNTLAKLNPHTPVLSLAWSRAAAPSNRNAGGWVYKYEGRGKKRRRLKHFQRVGNSRRGTGFASGDNVAPFRKSVNALRYQVQGTAAVRIGFYRGATGGIDFTISELIARQAEAKDFTVTDKMRRYLFSAGMPVKAGTRIHRPARPWFNKTVSDHHDEIQAYCLAKTIEALDRYRTGRAKQQ
jgi:hypothetical protein